MVESEKFLKHTHTHTEIYLRLILYFKSKTNKKICIIIHCPFRFWNVSDS